MHAFTEATEALARRIFEIGLARRRGLPPLNAPQSQETLAAALGDSITASGIGPEETLRRFMDSIVPATISGDHPRFLAFIPNAPTQESLLAEMLMCAFPSYGGSWLEGAGLVQAENEALSWIAGLARMPEGAGGCFVQGGTTGNLAALHAARLAMRQRRGGRPDRWAVVVSEESHSSVAAAAAILDVDLILVPVDSSFHMQGEAVRAVLAEAGDRVFAVVATAGATNLGVIDDLDGIGQACNDAGVWFHVDGAYGLAALASMTARERLNGIERADSFIVDPHKWLFAPYDSCALIYRRPEDGRRAHAQHAAYLDAEDMASGWDPSDYAIHLTRRARGFPLWFSLAINGTAAYTAAIDNALLLAKQAAAAIRQRPYLSLLADPELTVLGFKRQGWSSEQYAAWSEQLLIEGRGLVLPSTVKGETILRLVILNPLLKLSDIEELLDSLGDAVGGAELVDAAAL